ncbi:Protein dennd6a [Globomyces sp. JEL0801]|nr:Protein dennd6a [Globomyces sp. JEL0801]
MEHPSIDTNKDNLSQANLKSPGRSAISAELLDILTPNGNADHNLQELDLGNLWQWMLCFSVVNFDLELGHALEYTYPPVPFSDAEQKTLCFSAFPDSNSYDQTGDSVFIFSNITYLKNAGMRNGEFTQKLYLKQYQECNFTRQDQFDAATTGFLPIETDGYTYGHVFFRQQQDSEIRRGFFQKALVLLTPYPWPGLFSHLLALLGPAVMDQFVANRSNSLSGTEILCKSSLLETACVEISQWPPPPSSLTAEVSFETISLQLPFFSTKQYFSFPPYSLFPQLYPLKSRNQDQTTFESTKPIVCNPGKFYQMFHRSLDSIWTCWELMVLGEPIAVMSDTPKACSDAVLALVELIKPMPFGGDYRPYFTIQDSDFTSLTNRGRQPPQGVVLGVTNRVFSKILEHWPHVLEIGKQKKSYSIMDDISIGMNGMQIDELDMSIEKCKFKHKPFFSKDRKLLKAIFEVGVKVKGIDAVNNSLRYHFINSVAPSLPVASKRPVYEFYKLFLLSSNFAAWLQQKTDETYRDWRNHYLDVLCTQDIEIWAKQSLKKGDMVGCIDLLMRLKEELRPKSVEYIESNLSDFESVTTDISNSTPEIENDQGIDLASIKSTDPELVSLRSSRHKKANTTPLPYTRSWSPAPQDRITPVGSPHVSKSQLFSEVHQNFKLPSTKSSLKGGDNLGIYIPTPVQYGQLTHQLELLINLLPPELGANGRIK